MSILLLIFSGIKGTLSSISGFLKDNWKWVLPIILVIGAYWWHNKEIDKAYDRGVVAEAGRVKDLIEAEDARNREFEKNLAAQLAQYVLDNAAEDKVRVETETKSFHTIEQVIKNNPVFEQCIVDKEIIEERNKIRALGPKIEEDDNE